MWILIKSTTMSTALHNRWRNEKQILMHEHQWATTRIVADLQAETYLMYSCNLFEQNCWFCTNNLQGVSFSFTFLQLWSSWRVWAKSSHCSYGLALTNIFSNAIFVIFQSQKFWAVFIQLVCFNISLLFITTSPKFLREQKFPSVCQPTTGELFSRPFIEWQIVLVTLCLLCMVRVKVFKEVSNSSLQSEQDFTYLWWNLTVYIITCYNATLDVHKSSLSGNSFDHKNISMLTFLVHNVTPMT